MIFTRKTLFILLIFGLVYPSTSFPMNQEFYQKQTIPPSFTSCNNNNYCAESIAKEGEEEEEEGEKKRNFIEKLKKYWPEDEDDDLNGAESYFTPEKLDKLIQKKYKRFNLIEALKIKKSSERISRKIKEKKYSSDQVMPTISPFHPLKLVKKITILEEIITLQDMEKNCLKKPFTYQHLYLKKLYADKVLKRVYNLVKKTH